MKILKLLIIFCLSFPLMSQAEEGRTIVISFSQANGRPSQNEPMNYDHSFRSGIGNPDMDDYFRRYNNGTLVIAPHPEPYESSFKFFNERKKSLATGALVIGVGHMFFHYALKKSVNRFFAYLFTRKSTPRHRKKSPWINRLTYFTHFVFDLSCAFAGYKTAQLCNLDKSAREES